MGSTRRNARRNVVTLAVACAVIAAFGTVAAINATTAHADPPLQTPAFQQCPAIGADTSCGLLIELNSTGAHVLTDNTQPPYDQTNTNAGDDTLVGVLNSSDVPVSSLPLTAAPSSGEPPFRFDGDGICIATYTGGGGFTHAPAASRVLNDTGSAGCAYGTTGYEGPNTSFSAISGNFLSGTVNFSPALQPGQSTYFALEGALDTADFEPPTSTTTTPTTTTTTPTTTTTTPTTTTTVPSVPGAPSIGSVLAGNGAVGVSFTPGGQGSSDTLGYLARCVSPNGDPGSNSDSGSPIVVPGLTNGATYTCSVTAWNSVGNSPPSGNSSAVTPTPTSKRMDDCTDQTVCNATIPQAPSKLAPGQAAAVVGTPSDPTGTVVLTGTLGTLDCDSINGSKPGPITELFDEGFSPKTRLTITMTLKIASSTTPGQICYESEIPFFSQQSPTEKHPGTGYLLLCSKINNIAPCVLSSKQVGANIVVKFVVPGGDPRFCVLLPKGRLQWLAGAATAKLGSAFNAQLQSTGGRAPVHWKISSGKLPSGLGLNGTTGSISGKPKVKGSQTAVVSGTDSAKPPQSAKLSVPIKVT